MPRQKLSFDLVVREASALADEQGLDAVNVSAVARRLEVRAPSLYAHVRDVSALKDGIAEAALEDLGGRISLEIAGRSGPDALRGLAEAHRTFAREGPGRWQSLQRRVGSAVADSDAAGSLVTLMRAVLRGYGLPEGEHVHAIRLLGGAINGYLSLEQSGSFGHRDPDPDVSWERALDALDVLLRSWPSEEDQKTIAKESR